jgi:hypothetical protein
MIITPDGLKQQIYNRIRAMVGKSKDDKIQFNDTQSVIVTSHNVYTSVTSTDPNNEIYITGLGKNLNGSPVAFIKTELSTVKRDLDIFNIDDIYVVYQQLSNIISPSTAIYAEILDEA